ncbi:uncharacterized protein SPPG_09189 [Spizellomyces punctatus DAOM BR117]|uniref:Uncharacterized protein n=1 Tax=Spizellomyces punctatus (strain DAOM BR117) TaxID=645134 RepID=A0A0L0HG40_SPIPD|nr:uncharacterized protein SPPG_09189 [Spizellomyces punctatus DAOM BR117]KND00038.1 hypothetical protein SPPG_09189 [Spizellomyces punctatus DAOM BR117]|eukprot:XP_016608077.1 hypothetical protein SPPG_09189 [Spizellomyces punctatus DAOM BR117]
MRPRCKRKVLTHRLWTCALTHLLRSTGCKREKESKCSYYRKEIHFTFSTDSAKNAGRQSASLAHVLQALYGFGQDCKAAFSQLVHALPSAFSTDLVKEERWSHNDVHVIL